MNTEELVARRLDMVPVCSSTPDLLLREVFSEDLWAQLRLALSSATIAALADAGLVIVPREPTEAMLDSGGRERSPMAPTMAGSKKPGQTFRYKAGDIWKAMIAASLENDEQ